MAVPAPRLTLAERLYLPEVVRGVAVTMRHFVRNLTLHTLHLFGLAKDRRASATTQYPEERKVYSDGYRGAHRLTLKPDGAIRCTACFLCATACPAKCIHIEAGEHPDPQVEKYPVRYEIDTLQCIYCGMCVEACPCDAIRMDTLDHAKPVYKRGEAILDREELLERGVRSIAVQGGAGAFWREKVAGTPQTQPEAALLPGGSPAGPTPVETFAPRAKASNPTGTAKE